jgi:FOG: HPt domain
MIMSMNRINEKEMLIMGLLEDLKALNVNVDEGLERMMGNSSLYERMLVKFIKVMNDLEVSPDFDNNDYAEIIEKTHTIKGASGNLSITPIYEAYTEIVNLLRSDKPDEAKQILRDILPVQKEILACIEKYA